MTRIQPAGLLLLQATITYAQLFPGIYSCKQLESLSCGRGEVGECELRAWEKAGCDRAKQCAGTANVKECCDERDTIPFENDIFYDGYMGQCAPMYQLTEQDYPVHRFASCSEVQDWSCSEGMDSRLCDLRGWERSGCQQAEKCKDSGDVKECCDDRYAIPFESGPYYTAYMGKCAPQYNLTGKDYPEHAFMDCEDLEYFSCPDWMDKRMCELRAWQKAVSVILARPKHLVRVTEDEARAACGQAKECKGDTNAKECCDNRDVIPYEAGVYYDGYMEKCAPELESMAGQAPVHKIYSCDELRGLSCPSWMDGRLCTLRSWEMAACARRQQCQEPASRENCCKMRYPELANEAYYDRFMAICMADEW